MSHLSPDTFVDLLDGTAREDAVPHLRDCQQCQEQLAEVRAAWQAAVDVDVPEPSPLFWDHLSRRVHDAVAAEPVTPRWWQVRWTWPTVGLAGAAFAAVALVFVLQAPRTAVTDTAATVPQRADVLESVEPDPLPALIDDASIGLVADLASDLDVESALPELGLGARGAADRALSELDADERVELRRLLAEEMGTL